MIKINLLPEELIPRKEEKLTVVLQLVLYILPLVFVLFVIIHLYLGSSLLFKKLQYNSLDKQWTQLGPTRQKVIAWRRQYKAGSQEAEQMNKLVARRIAVSDKMQTLVAALPNGIWFNRLSLKQKRFRIEGSVVSLRKEEVKLLNLFLNRLKKDKQFFKDFINLELGRINMRILGGFSIMDFVLEGELK